MEEVVFDRAEIGGAGLDDLPGMAVERLCEPRQPGDRELALTELEETDLLIGRAKGAGELIKREVPGFAQRS